MSLVGPVVFFKTCVLNCCSYFSKIDAMMSVAELMPDVLMVLVTVRRVMKVTLLGNADPLSLKVCTITSYRYLASVCIKINIIMI